MFKVLFFFDFKSPLNALFLKNGATKTTDCTFGQTSYFPLSLTPIRTLLMEPNLKKSTILFVLRYIRYKGNLRFKGVPLIALSSEPSSASFFHKTYF